MDFLNNHECCLVKRPRRTEEKKGREWRNTQRNPQTLGRGVSSEGKDPKTWKDGVNRRDENESNHVEKLLVGKMEGEIMRRGENIQIKNLWLVFMWSSFWKNSGEKKMTRQTYITGQTWHHFFLCLLFASLCPNFAASQVRVILKSNV